MRQLETKAVPNIKLAKEERTIHLTNAWTYARTDANALLSYASDEQVPELFAVRQAHVSLKSLVHPSRRHGSHRAIHRTAGAMGSTSHCSAAPAPQRAIDCCCPQGDTSAAVLNATSVADHARGVWSVVTTLLSSQLPH